MPDFAREPSSNVNADDRWGFVARRTTLAAHFLDSFPNRLNLTTIPMATQSNNKWNKPKTGKPVPAPVVKPAAAAPAKAAPAKAGKASEPTQQEIEVRAFEIFVSEGCREGTDLENWLRAERELRSGR
jgi:hypothetical protein